MEQTFIPDGYKSSLDIWQTEQGIKFIKDTFQIALSSELKLRRITAPLFLQAGTGLNDNLNGVEAPVSFRAKGDNGNTAEIVQSLAKWKRFALWRHNFKPGIGVYTDMNAIRPDEITDNIHSLYVDQWDWEKVIKPSERTVETLYSCVRHIYSAIRRTQFLLSERFPVLDTFLPEDIMFFHAQDLLEMYPEMTPRERETEAAKKYGAIFVRGIGGKLSDGTIHDGRSPDYDDWSTLTGDKSALKGEPLAGLNGDIVVWNPVLQSAFEISSMGIRVDAGSLERQLAERGTEERKSLYFHQLLLEGKLPQTMGGGIGQSRLCMLLLKKCHIGEVQSSMWPDETLRKCEDRGVFIF
ncbi:Aspartate--ammonia ligase [Bacteroidales bacterium CF]|jgi:aspartate--ammonia ligase, AsnA-type|nr:Aspartate--ammonia ligase [Bacteroidales bacterium CF]NCB97910.1 aspartate--ammonia ligase [Bacteroidia bacterium]